MSNITYRKPVQDQYAKNRTIVHALAREEITAKIERKDNIKFAVLSIAGIVAAFAGVWMVA